MSVQLDGVGTTVSNEQTHSHTPNPSIIFHGASDSIVFFEHVHCLIAILEHHKVSHCFIQFPRVTNGMVQV